MDREEYTLTDAQPDDYCRPRASTTTGDRIRDVCGLLGKEFFAATLDREARPLFFFSGAHKLPDRVIRQFFRPGVFVRVMNRIQEGRDPNLYLPADKDVMCNTRVRRRRSSAATKSSNLAQASRRKNRGCVGDEDRKLVQKTRCLVPVGDSAALWDFYQLRFKNCQQTACKLIAKAWVKVVEPKKQSTYPYSGSDEKAPKWWPKPWGPTKNDRVRHKEPDHLYKRERVDLLTHILRMVMEPTSKQYPDIKKLNLSVKKLEEAAIEALSSFFVECESNQEKRVYLDEIFQAARQEERFRHNEMDESTPVYILADEKITNSSIAHEERSFIKEADDGDQRPDLNKSISIPSSQRPMTVPNPSSNLRPSEASYINELPVRESAFQAPLIRDIGQYSSFIGNHSLHTQTQGYVAVPSSPNLLTIDIVTSPHPSRGPCVFSDFGSLGGTNTCTQPWQVQAGTGDRDDTIPLYAYSGQQAAQQVAINPNTSFMIMSSDSSTSTYEANQNSLLRPHVITSGYEFTPEAFHAPMGQISQSMMNRDAARQRQQHM